MQDAKAGRKPVREYKKTIITSMKVIILLAIILTEVSYGQQPFLRKEQFNVEDGLAIGGYDPVAYFTDKAALKGKKDFAFMHQGIQYYFASAVHRDRFKAAPENYEPQYGGWCAYAMGDNGEKVEVDPETFKIIDGRLYLFYNKYFNNTLRSWNKDETRLKSNADRNWSKFYNLNIK
jgi:YHS domain-containing protein